jgi:uncharacterized protein (TIGR02996 family)
MDEGPALLEAILQNPEEDSCRLVYADWLEERGDARADWLRLTWAIRQLARKARIPPFGSGDVAGASLRLHRRDPVGRLGRLWGCACVRFLPLLNGGVLWEAIQTRRLRRWLVATELEACGITVPLLEAPEVDTSPAGPAEAAVFQRYPPTPLSFALTQACRLQTLDGESVTALPAGSPAARQDKQARKWCFGLAQRILKLPVPA